MILASAIKFNINKTNEDVILCGARHSDIFIQLRKLGFEPHIGYKEIEQGFIDHNCNFLTREEAYDYAVKNGQISSQTVYQKEKHGSNELFSEDLW